MLKFLSAFNLMAGTLYFLCYLSGGGIYAISGNLAVLIFNGAALYGLEKGRHKWNLIQYLSAPASMLFVFYSSWYLARSAIETSFATRALWLLLIFSWVVVDAQGEILGRLSSKIAMIIRGKNKPEYTPHVDCGDNVIVINADKVKLTGNKFSEKEYISYTGYPGGQRFISPKELMAKHPTRVIEKAVRGRRKTAVARIYLKEGNGSITVNEVAEVVGQYDVTVNVAGGGIKGQAEAVRLAIAKAIVELDAEKKPALRAKGLMTRDMRMVERKKPGRKKAHLLDAGVHFGHLTRKWNPKMAPYIFMERNGIHIIDLNKTLTKTEEAASAIKQIVKSGRKILFVATKKQAKEIVAEQAKKVNMPFVTERWLGDGTYSILSKKERLMIQRERIKLESLLGGIADLNRLPAAIFLIDVKKEHIAVSEALKLNIPTFAMVDTNSDPSNIDFPIPANDDATKSISLITDVIIKAIEEGLDERKREKDDEAEKEAVAAKAAADAPETAAPGERRKKVSAESEEGTSEA
eukprot:gene13191-15501_t